MSEVKEYRVIHELGPQYAAPAVFADRHQAEDLVKMQRVIAEMTEKSRTVFLMNRIDGMTYNEIAESLKVSVKAIEKQMSKALLHLKKNLGEKM